MSVFSFPFSYGRLVRRAVAEAAHNARSSYGGSGVDQIEGCIDEIYDHAITGWACDRSMPTRRLEIHVSVGERLYRVLADRYRADLAAAGKGDGRCGFEVSVGVSNLSGCIVSARVGEGGRDLTGSPLTATLTNMVARAETRGLVTLICDEIARAQMLTRSAR